MNLDQIIGYQKCLYELQIYFSEIQKSDGNFPTGNEVLDNFILPKLDELGEKLKDIKGIDALITEHENNKIKSL